MIHFSRSLLLQVLTCATLAFSVTTAQAASAKILQCSAAVNDTEVTGTLDVSLPGVQLVLKLNDKHNAVIQLTAPADLILGLTAAPDSNVKYLGYSLAPLSNGVFGIALNDGTNAYEVSCRLTAN